MLKQSLMVCNISANSHTKYMDMRYMYVNEHVEDGIVKIAFINSNENGRNMDLHEKLQIKWGVRSLNDHHKLKIFENRMKGVRDGVLLSNIKLWTGESGRPRQSVKSAGCHS